MTKDDQARCELNAKPIAEYKAKVTEIAQAAYGLEANDLIGDDLEIFNALCDHETPNEFVKRIGEKMDLELNEGFQFKRKFKVNAHMTTYCHIIIEAHDATEAYDIARETDGGDFITEEGGDWQVFNSAEEVE